MLPMGTIVTVCMLIGMLCLLTQIIEATANRLPVWLIRALGGIVFCAGAWNTFWHGLRNLTNFWGIAALLSGVVMMLGAALIIRFNFSRFNFSRFNIGRFKHEQADLRLQRVVVLFMLTACFLLYAITISRL